ncbi:hypothetical protein THAOC_32157 [Thalassiosira oceanica]|uniref:SUEL-type lectin domain-containing protein n=1 Tax=Thalassiosira oceanica TaxID=159749 RepID=K0R7Q5_THAOC|nr:hypothetical protein THAOC_32157 [Thalassiosira oceanica]|eukprot:EJK49005.1 hypothetical protein THAOC_32157 [Thalassiosira oceanica]
MKIWPVLLLTITTVAATGSASSEQSSEQTKLLSSVFNKLKTEFIGRAVHQALLGSSQDQDDACLKGIKTVNADSSYSSAFSHINSCPEVMHINRPKKTATATVDFSSCQPAFGDVQLACTRAGGQFQTIPEQKVTCRISGGAARGVTATVEMLNFPGCLGKDCPRDFLAIDEVKQIREKQLAESAEAENKRKFGYLLFRLREKKSSSDESSKRRCWVDHCTVLYCTVLYCTVLYCTVLYCTVLYCTVLYCTVLDWTGLYCTVLCTVLYCTVLYCDAILPPIDGYRGPFGGTGASSRTISNCRPKIGGEDRNLNGSALQRHKRHICEFVTVRASLSMPPSRTRARQRRQRRQGTITLCHQ